MAEIAPRKNIILSKYPNQYPACWLHVSDEVEKAETPKPVPTFDIDATSLLMEHTYKLASQKNNISEDDDWELKVLKFGWTPRQTKIFNKVLRILDYDRLARLSCKDNNKQQEIILVRVAIDKSAERMRKLLASFEWELTIIQWLHTLLMENLPASYLAAYLEIMQTLKSIVPSLVDKMIFWKPGNINQELLATVLKKPWQPTLVNKYRKLQGNALIVVIPPLPRVSTQPPRIQRLYTLFTTLSPILPIQLNTATSLNQQSLQSWAEQTISITRSKIQELKNENPDRRLLLIGMHSSSSIALQVALVEQVSGVVCFGFSYNTVHGPRGLPDDYLLKVNCPILFMIGQNSVRASDEELELIREKLSQNTSLQTMTVGGADDFLRISKKKRKFEGLTQEMVDNLIVDEIADFASKCIQRPLAQSTKQSELNRLVDSSTGHIRKRKNSLDEFETPKVTKVSKVKAQNINSSSSNDLTEKAVQSIMYEVNATPKSVFLQRGDTVMKAHKKQNQQYLNLGIQNRRAVDSLQLSQKITSSIPRSTSITHNSTLGGKGKLLPITPQPKTHSFSPPKFTIVRSPAPSTISSSSPSTSASASTQQQSSFIVEGGESADANIFDMPVIFADSEGNVVPSSSGTTTINLNQSDSTTGQMKQFLFRTGKGSMVTINPSTQTTMQKPIVTFTKNRNVLIQKPTFNTQKKLLVLNGIVGRPVSASNIIIPSQQQQHQQQFQTTGQVIKVPQKQIINPRKSIQQTQSYNEASSSGKKIEIIDHTIIKQGTSAAFVNLTDAKTIPSKISISNSGIKSGQLIVKTSSLKPITLSGTKQFGNITVNKFNINSLTKQNSNNSGNNFKPAGK